MLMNTFAALLAGFALNIIIGSPNGIFNPENTVPRFAFAVEKRLRKHYQDSDEAHTMAGGVLLFLTLLVFVVPPAAVLLLVYGYAPILSFILDCYLSWAAFSVIRTKNELSYISRSLRSGRLDLARTGMAKLTGTSCRDMSEDEIIRRSVEIAADCGADNAAGVLFFSAIFGGIGGYCFRVIALIRRTYSRRSDRTDGFGKASRDLWAALDLIPAHIAALMMNFAASVFGLSTENSFPTFTRDRKHVADPNLAPCRCVIAGVLGITLTARSFIKDGYITFLTVGKERHPCDHEDVSSANEIMYAATFYMLLLFGGIKLAVALLLR